MASEPVSAYVAECYALIAAAWYAAAALPHWSNIFVADCLAALHGASGHFSAQLQGVSGICRRMHSFCAAACHAAPGYLHVTAHAGHRHNELADLLAKEAAKGRCIGCFRWVVQGSLLPMSRLLHPLVLKLALRGSEAIGFKAGLLARLYKNKGAHSDCKAHRGILLAPVLSKAVHQCLRPALSMHHEDVAPDMHLSSRKGQSAIFGSHAVRTFLRLGRHQHKATAAVFTDIESAYYASTRELAIRRIDLDVPDEVLEGLRLTADDAAELRQRLAEPPSLPAEGADAWTCAVTAEVHHGTWMVVTGDSVPVWTRRGSRPGSAYADLVFAATVRRVLQS